MLATVLGLAIASCVPLGATVSYRTADALEKTAKPLADAEASKRLESLRSEARRLMATTVDKTRYRSSSLEALDRFAAQVEAYLLVLPSLPRARVLDAIVVLVDLTVWIEGLVDIGPADWPDDTWADYREAFGCQSSGYELIVLGLRFADEHNVRGPARARLENARHGLERETISF